jgi:hypothetical protein
MEGGGLSNGAKVCFSVLGNAANGINLVAQRKVAPHALSSQKLRRVFANICCDGLQRFIGGGVYVPAS